MRVAAPSIANVVIIIYISRFVSVYPSIRPSGTLGGHARACPKGMPFGPDSGMPRRGLEKAIAAAGRQRVLEGGGTPPKIYFPQNVLP